MCLREKYPYKYLYDRCQDECLYVWTCRHGLVQLDTIRYTNGAHSKAHKGLGIITRQDSIPSSKYLEHLTSSVGM